jgi:hypothetical protein
VLSHPEQEDQALEGGLAALHNLSTRVESKEALMVAVPKIVEILQVEGATRPLSLCPIAVSRCRPCRRRTEMLLRKCSKMGCARATPVQARCSHPKIAGSALSVVRNLAAHRANMEALMCMVPTLGLCLAALHDAEVARQCMGLLRNLAVRDESAAGLAPAVPLAVDALRDYRWEQGLPCSFSSSDGQHACMVVLRAPCEV